MKNTETNSSGFTITGDTVLLDMCGDYEASLQLLF